MFVICKHVLIFKNPYNVSPGRVAQLVGVLPANQKVTGSTPTQDAYGRQPSQSQHLSLSPPVSSTLSPKVSGSIFSGED